MKKKEEYKYDINGNEYNVIINRKKIKNTYIRIDEQLNIVVNTNRFVSRRQINSLIRQYESKITNKIEKKQEKQLPRHKIYYLGQIKNVEYQKANRFSYQIVDHAVIINSNKDHDLALEQFYKSEAKKIFNERFKICYSKFSSVYKIKYPELSIRKMKKRYGTCYYNKNKILLNLNLIKSDYAMIDFVIYHELTHFIHPNHSKDFYKTLGVFVPKHRLLKEDLNKL